MAIPLPVWSDMWIYCCHCKCKVIARLTNGKKIYPHRGDLHSLRFWFCEGCGNYVGCHKGTDNPLGNIPTPELRKARGHIHALIDPLWKSGKVQRKELYHKLSNALGWEYHTAQIRSIDEARKVYKTAKTIIRSL